MGWKQTSTMKIHSFINEDFLHLQTRFPCFVTVYQKDVTTPAPVYTLLSVRVLQRSLEVAMRFSMTAVWSRIPTSPSWWPYEGGPCFTPSICSSLACCSPPWLCWSSCCLQTPERRSAWVRTHWVTDKMLVLFRFTVSSWSLPGWISFLLLSLRRLFSPGVLYLLPGITVLLSLTVFMLMVAEIMPATSDSVPLIGQFLHAFMRMFLWSEPSCILFFRGWCVNSYPIKTVYSYCKWKVLSLHLP